MQDLKKKIEKCCVFAFLTIPINCISIIVFPRNLHREQKNNNLNGKMSHFPCILMAQSFLCNLILTAI
jgi:hypothetical protein